MRGRKASGRSTKPTKLEAHLLMCARTHRHTWMCTPHTTRLNVTLIPCLPLPTNPAHLRPLTAHTAQEYSRQDICKQKKSSPSLPLPLHSPPSVALLLPKLLVLQKPRLAPPHPHLYTTPNARDTARVASRAGEPEATPNAREAAAVATTSASPPAQLISPAARGR
jgi:hypothetical protein